MGTDARKREGNGLKFPRLDSSSPTTVLAGRATGSLATDCLSGSDPGSGLLMLLNLQHYIHLAGRNVQFSGNFLDI